MFAFLLTLLILDALLLSVVVLLQAGQGGGLASLGGATTDTVLGGRQAVTLLTKATWWCGGIFLVLALVLSLVPRGGGDRTPAGAAPAATPAPAPSAPLPLGGTPDGPSRRPRTALSRAGPKSTGAAIRHGTPGPKRQRAFPGSPRGPPNRRSDGESTRGVTG